MSDAGWTDAAIDKHLGNLYYATGDPAAYGGVERLYKRAKDLGIPVDRERVRRYLADQVTYQLHKPVRHRFRRNQTLVYGKDEQWQADLADVSKLAKDNDGNHFILTCIDVLSRYAWAVPVRSKSATDMLSAVRQLFKMAAPRKPERLQTDKGKEFYNSAVRDFLKEQGVELFSTNSDNKAALVERFNRTLKGRLYKYFTASKTTRYINVLQDAVYSYNHSHHRTIDCRPVDVESKEDERRVWKRVYHDSKEAQLSNADQQLRQQPAYRKMGVGARVRMSRWKGDFEKGYVPNWGREQYIIKEQATQHRGGHPRTVYKLVDKEAEDIEGYCYPDELQVVSDKAAQVLEVEKVLRTRRSGGQNETLVKFRGWPDKFNRWLTDEELERYQEPLRDQQQQ